MIFLVAMMLTIIFILGVGFVRTAYRELAASARNVVASVVLLGYLIVICVLIRIA